MSSLAERRRDRLRTDPGAPLITDCTQARVELSGATIDLWVSKAVNLLRLDLDLPPGAPVAVELPLHWMTTVIVMAVWESGADVVLPLGGPPDLVFGTEPGPGQRILVTLDPLGLGGGTGAGIRFPADVRGQPDRLVLPPPAPGGVRTDQGHMGAAELLTAGRAFAEEVGLRAGGRLLTSRAPSDLSGLVAAIAAPLAVDAGVVYGDLSMGQRRQEGVTAQA